MLMLQLRHCRCGRLLKVVLSLIMALFRRLSDPTSPYGMNANFRNLTYGDIKKLGKSDLPELT